MYKLKAGRRAGSMPNTSDNHVPKGTNVSRRAIVLLLILAAAGSILSGCGSGTSSSEKWQTISPGSNKLNNNNADAPKKMTFASNLPAGFEMPADDVGEKLLREYGAVFVGGGGAVRPNTVIFKNAEAVSAWQAQVPVSKENIGGIEIELQTPAMNALKEAISEGRARNLTMTPRGNDAARRSYEDTEELWASRVDPGLEHWAETGKLSRDEAQRIKALSPFEQVPEIFKLEKEGMYFSKDLSKSIIYSVAPPGSSQHLSMLALDVVENENSEVRDTLARHGWFQTVVSDLPHFTYLGVGEKELPGLGLSKTSQGGRTFWTPSL